MPWSHFTTLLDGTRPITKLERDELYDQLAAKFCPPRYTLPSATMTPIKASLLITDRAAIFDSLFSSTTFGRLETLITGVSGAFSNTAAAKTSALALAGITAGNLGTILAALTDDYRLWNFLRSWIDLLTPNPPPNPTFVSRTASASKTKCGLDEYPGYVSSPPKIFSRITLGGTLTFTEWSGAGCTGTCLTVTDIIHSGYCTVSRTSCTDDVTLGQKNIKGYDDCARTTLVVDDTTENCTFFPDYTGPSFSSAFTNISRTVTSSDCEYTGSYTETLTDEYTTAQLIADALAAIPAFSGSYSAGAQTALNDLTSDEVTASLRSMQYKFTLPTLTGYTAYRIDWAEVFTPTVGAPTSTAKSYIWDLSASETPAYTITAPSTEGSTAVVITGITASC